MWELDHKESWALKNWCFWTVVLEKTLESPLDCKEIQPVQPKGNQSWIFIGSTDAEAEATIFWQPDAKNWLIRKDPDVGKDWRQEEKGTTEAEMVGWHYWFNGHESEQAPGVGQGRVACCRSWGCKKLDTTEWLNLTEILEKNRLKKWTETCGIIRKDPTSISSDSQKERKKESQKSIWRNNGWKFSFWEMIHKPTDSR